MKNTREAQAGMAEPKKNPAQSAVLSIAGFDPSSGAGFTADLKVFAAHGLYGLACPTALTVQSTQGVERTEPVRAELVAGTLRCLSHDIPIAGVKIGMLNTAQIVRAVAGWLATVRAEQPDLPVVLDPVLRSSSGVSLLEPEALAPLLTGLLPLISVLTPNLPEAALLSGAPVHTRKDAERAAGVLLGPQRAVVITGGHFGEGEPPDDFLLTAAGGAWFSGPRVDTRSTHGTGCAFSSALLAHLVLGQALPDAVRAAKQYVRQALQHAYPLGQGRGPMHHLFNFAQEKTGETAQPSE